MKSSIFAVLIVTLVGHAAHAEMTQTRIHDPQINGVGFSSQSHDNGVCRALGYDSAWVGPRGYRTTSHTPMMRVDENGQVTATDRGNGASLITEMICLSETPPTGPRVQIREVRNPTFPTVDGLGVRFSSSSNEHGVCKTLGYESAATGGARFTSVEESALMLVDENGRVIRGPRERIQQISEIVCLGPQQQETRQRATLIEAPTHPTSSLPFAGSSDSSGVCKVLGYAAAGATLYGAANYISMTQVNFTGHPTNVDPEFGLFQITTIICVR